MPADSSIFAIPDWLQPADSSRSTHNLLDELAAKLGSEPIAQSEKSLLEKAYWSQGIALRLREDSRFQRTPWGNWLAAGDDVVLINDWLYAQFLEVGYLSVSVDECFSTAATALEGRLIFCPADPRFKLTGDELRLNPSLLSRNPHFTEDPGDGRYVTHLPFYELNVIAASEPAGEWGAQAADHGFAIDAAVAPEAWIRVASTGTSLNQTMFISRIQGESMDDGRRGLSDGALVVFGYWPKGTRQGNLVVVRGAFHDHEMGSFAFKEYQADTRDEQGEHKEITLRSLNPDKQRYPDIHLRPEQDDDLVVVAEYLRVLGEQDYVRTPKPAVPPGERDIQDEDAVSQRQKSLGGIHENVFNSNDEQDKDGVEIGKPGLEWVCLAAEQGGVALSVQPLLFLPRFVKKLELRYADQTDVLLASNHRNHYRLKSVNPGAESYRLLPPANFEEDFEHGEFDAWVIDGLDDAVVHWFRVDASGVGRLISGNSWSEGSTYRALAVSQLLTGVPKDVMAQLSGGWSMVEVELSDEPPEWLSILMGKSNSAQHKSRLSWVERSPVSWRSTNTGEELAVFNCEAPPMASIQLGTKTAVDIKPGALAILHNGKSAEKLILKEGSAWRLQLADLQVGNYVLQIVPADKQIQPAYAAFVISNEWSPMPPPARFSLQAYDADEQLVESKTLLERRDWALLDGQLTFCDEITVLLPPWWSIRIQLHTSVYQFGITTAADEFGCLNFVEVLAEFVPHMQYLAAASITLDAGELGAIQLEHYREQLPESVRAAVFDLWNGFIPRKDQYLPEPELLFQAWLAPLFGEWRGRLQPAPDEKLLEQREARRLYRWVNCEWENSRVQAHIVPLLLIDEGCDVKRGGSLLAACEAYLQTQGRRRMLVTDGLRFAQIKRSSGLQVMWLEMGAALDDLRLFEEWLGKLEGGS